MRNALAGMATSSERKEFAALRILNSNGLNNGNDHNEQGIQVT